ncbi:TGRM2 protein, partial [Psilopogon haemacephalus]|nr:TGRM2 protein [Psilopogon haemacephalus]
MDPEVDEIIRVLLHKMGESNKFIQEEASRSLGIMVASVTPVRTMAALMASGTQHCNALVRKFAAEQLLSVVELIGAEKLLSGRLQNLNLLVHTLVKFAQDNHQDTR